MIDRVGVSLTAAVAARSRKSLHGSYLLNSFVDIVILYNIYCNNKVSL